MFGNPLVQALLMAKAKQDPIMSIVMNLTTDLLRYDDENRMSSAVVFLRVLAKYGVTLGDAHLTDILKDSYGIKDESLIQALLVAKANFGQPTEVMMERLRAVAPADLNNRDQVLDSLAKCFMTDEQRQAASFSGLGGLGDILSEMLGGSMPPNERTPSNHG